MPAGFEPAITSLRGWRPNQLDEGIILEIRAGFEPVIATVKGLCPNLLDERTLWQGIYTLPLLCYGVAADKNIIYMYMQHGRKGN